MQKKLKPPYTREKNGKVIVVMKEKRKRIVRRYKLEQIYAADGTLFAERQVSKREQKRFQCGEKWPRIPVKKSSLQLQRIGKGIARSFKKCRAYSSDIQYYLSLSVCSGGACGRQWHSLGVYKKAAVLGSYEACNSLSYIYAWYGEVKNINKATYWLYRAVELAQRAAAKGYVAACELLGHVYLFGSTDFSGNIEETVLFKERDCRRGLSYLERVLAHGGSERKDGALRGLGIAYACGLGVEKDEKQSAFFFSQLEDCLLGDVEDAEKRSARKKNIDRINQRLIKNVKERLGIL